MPVFCFPLFSYLFILGSFLFFSFSFLFVFNLFQHLQCYMHHIFSSLFNACKYNETMSVNFDTQYGQDHSQKHSCLTSNHKEFCKGRKLFGSEIEQILSLPTQSTRSVHFLTAHLRQGWEDLHLLLAGCSH